MTNFRPKLVLTTGATILACLSALAGTADARSIAGALGRSTTPEVNGVKHHDCLSIAQNGSVMNVCPVSIGYYLTLPIDTFGKSRCASWPRVTGPPCSARSGATDESGGTLVLAQGITATLGSPQPIAINSHPVPDNGRLSVYCVLPQRSVIYTVNYTP